MESTASSLLLETLGVSFLGNGSLAWLKFSPVPGPSFAREELVERVRRAGDEIRPTIDGSRSLV